MPSNETYCNFLKIHKYNDSNSYLGIWVFCNFAKYLVSEVDHNLEAQAANSKIQQHLELNDASWPTTEANHI